MPSTPPTPSRTSRPSRRAAQAPTRRPTLAAELAGVALESFLEQLPAELRASVEAACPDEGPGSPWWRATDEVAEAIDTRLRGRVDAMLEGQG